MLNRVPVTCLQSLYLEFDKVIKVNCKKRMELLHCYNTRIIEFYDANENKLMKRQEHHRTDSKSSFSGKN